MVKELSTFTILIRKGGIPDGKENDELGVKAYHTRKRKSCEGSTGEENG